ncbi:MAG TPA: DinB family protein [Stellaceae bacterium]|nr:DinB family protein [Stellaceae bacterium]
MDGREQDTRLRVYWMPGCTSCLRTKEFLTKHGVPFVSVDVVADKRGFEELAELGLRRVPIVRRGKEWVDGQVLADVARIAGIQYGAPPRLAPEALAGRVDAVLAAAGRLLRQIPEGKLDTLLPNRPRSYRQLACHIFQIPELFLDLVEHGKRLEFADYFRDVPQGLATGAQLAEWGEAIRRRFRAWWEREGGSADLAAKADVYYGEQTLLDFLERTAWHAAQHTRQLQLVVETLGITTAHGLATETLAGLPLPTNVWDDAMQFA